MDIELHHAEKQASAIAHEYFWCVAGRHQACVERLRETSGAVPHPVWLSLCFEPLLFGLDFFGEYARKHYPAPEQELFVAELETAILWLVSTTLFEPNDVNFPPSQTPPSVQPARSRWVLTKGHERALAPFRRWCEVRQRQFHRRLDRNAIWMAFSEANKSSVGFEQALRGAKDGLVERRISLPGDCAARIRHRCGK